MGKNLLAWTFRTLSAARYGQEFSQRMTSESLRLLEKLRTIEPERGDLGSQLSFWFTTLDSATQHAGTKVMEVEVPVEYFAALAFLALDQASPYYRNGSVGDDTKLVLDVADVLQSTRTAALGLLQSCVEIGGPVSTGD